MKQTTITKPLYKVLNEERTQGELYIVETFPSLVFCNTQMHEAAQILPASPILIAQPTTDSCQQKTNAEYTALAVNNLHVLAEALENMIRAIEFDGEALPDIAQVAAEEAKEALSRIS